MLEVRWIQLTAEKVSQEISNRKYSLDPAVQNEVTSPPPPPLSLFPSSNLEI